MLRLVIALAVIVLRPAVAWSQADQLGKGVDLGVHAATNIADQGGLLGSVAIIGALLSLLLHGLQGWAIVSLFKRLQSSQDKRSLEAVESMKQVASTSISGTNAIAESSSRISKVEGALQDLGKQIGTVPEAIGRIESNQGKILDRLPKGAA